MFYDNLIIYLRVSKTYNWTKFKSVARLEKKYDDTLTEYFRSFYAMCKRLCGQVLTEEEGITIIIIIIFLCLNTSII